MYIKQNVLEVMYLRNNIFTQTNIFNDINYD